MKRTLSIIFAILIVGSMFALDFDWDGEFRSRSAMYNNVNGDPGGHTDNRFRLGLNTELHPNLNLRALLEISHMWGDWYAPAGGNINVDAKEVYIDMMVDAIKSRARVGHQPWADHRGLVMDDTFSGVSLMHDFSEQMNFKAAFGKYLENDPEDRHDDMQGFLFSFNHEADFSLGADAYFTWMRIPMGAKNSMFKYVSLAPYLNMRLNPIVLDATVIFQLNDNGYDFMENKVETETAFGVAVNVSGDMEPLEWNADLFFIGENDLFSLSNYYHNNLYLLGIGEHHDGLGLYTFATTADNYLALTGQAKFALTEKVKFFGAAGFVNGAGFEINGGMEYQLIPDLMGVALYGARAFMDEDATDKDPYAMGATLKLEF
ncbi:MAG TPA: hypothetical protein GX398_05715 [Candidatus Cloacimonetes bacterium]|nr:hypothetical protein [Candidatus Cloacimonadota bacterium]